MNRISYEDLPSYFKTKVRRYTVIEKEIERLGGWINFKRFVSREGTEVRKDIKRHREKISKLKESVEKLAIRCRRDKFMVNTINEVLEVIDEFKC